MLVRLRVCVCMCVCVYVPVCACVFVHALGRICVFIVWNGMHCTDKLMGSSPTVSETNHTTLLNIEVFYIRTEHY